MRKGFRYFWTHFVSSTDITSRVVDGSLESTFVLDTSKVRAIRWTPILIYDSSLS